jgi:hypothetical protein
MIKMFFSLVQSIAGSKSATIHYTKFDENANQQTQEHRDHQMTTHPHSPNDDDDWQQST